jgi:hypothetical protein
MEGEDGIVECKEEWKCCVRLVKSGRDSDLGLVKSDDSKCGTNTTPPQHVPVHTGGHSYPTSYVCASTWHVMSLKCAWVYKSDLMRLWLGMW